MNAFTTRDPSLPPAYSDSLDELSLAPLWTALHALLPNERMTGAAPHVWRWREVRPRLLDAARLVPMEQAERRVLVLRNPGLGGAYAITSTLFAGFQIIRPARPHPATTTRRPRSVSSSRAGAPTRRSRA
jgi:gentisate 1,2-dioxygenase